MSGEVGQGPFFFGAEVEMNKRLKGRIIEMFGSQTVFSKIVRRPESVISRVINGHQTPSPEEAERWAVLLQDKARRLFEVTEDKAP